MMRSNQPAIPRSAIREAPRVFRRGGGDNPDPDEAGSGVLLEIEDPEDLENLEMETFLWRGYEDIYGPYPSDPDDLEEEGLNEAPPGSVDLNSVPVPVPDPDEGRVWSYTAPCPIAALMASRIDGGLDEVMLRLREISPRSSVSEVERLSGILGSVVQLMTETTNALDVSSRGDGLGLILMAEQGELYRKALEGYLNEDPRLEG